MSQRAGLSRRVIVYAAAASTAAALTIVPLSAASAASAGCDARNNNTYQKLLECVTVDGVREHQAAFQAIADANDGNRAAGTTGYTQSVEYVVETMEAAGWTVTLDEFDFLYTPAAVLEQLTPLSASYETGAFTGSGNGDVTGSVTAVDLALGAGNASTSGCDVADFAGFPAGDIALVQRGTCSFGIKASNAQAAGATAVIIFNQGNTPDREGLIVGTLLPDGAGVTIPVVGGSYGDGVALSQAGSTAHIQVDPPENRPQVNVLAELKGTNDDNVVMAGAHLDSVQRGPGINDNGSGSAALLEIAQNMSKLKPQNTVRFAWWGAEESGLLGSNAYVNGLPQEELDRIALYLNFDMIGSPNYVFMVYDGDESGFPAPAGVPIPEGSIQIEDLFESFYTKAGEPYDDAQFSGRSDYQAFILNDIPSGGLFTGAEVVKTPEQEAIWGGTAGEQYDPCYHLACDTYDNNSLHALDVNSDAVAAAVLTYAYSTETVNGVKGKKVPGNWTWPEPAGPVGSNSGGGYEHDHDHDDVE
ncbi:aminopeptidase PaaP [Microbacterium awajiense]|uniref:Aminopeptidase PaaP n=1 Tax=Microbacterium awajiense TaxID=415214 RepID=A0ABP7AYC9_9MICO